MADSFSMLKMRKTSKFLMAVACSTVVAFSHASSCPTAMRPIPGVAGPINDVCRTGWVDTPLVSEGDPANCSNMNCLIFQDKITHALNMKTSDINLITSIKNSDQLPTDGAYIFVYKKSTGDILIRPIESSPAFLYPGNCRANSNIGILPCTTGSGEKGSYIPVRHTQLNGGWNPVWCAGMMRIGDGSICAVNNASGHFQPDKSCLLYVKNSLITWGIPMDKDAVFGDLRKVSIEQKSCRQIKGQSEL